MDDTIKLLDAEIQRLTKIMSVVKPGPINQPELEAAGIHLGRVAGALLTVAQAQLVLCQADDIVSRNSSFGGNPAVAPDKA